MTGKNYNGQRKFPAGSKAIISEVERSELNILNRGQTLTAMPVQSGYWVICWQSSSSRTSCEVEVLASRRHSTSPRVCLSMEPRATSCRRTVTGFSALDASFFTSSDSVFCLLSTSWLSCFCCACVGIFVFVLVLISIEGMQSAICRAMPDAAVLNFDMTLSVTGAAKVVGWMWDLSAGGVTEQGCTDSSEECTMLPETGCLFSLKCIWEESGTTVLFASVEEDCLALSIVMLLVNCLVLEGDCWFELFGSLSCFNLLLLRSICCSCEKEMVGSNRLISGRLLGKSMCNDVRTLDIELASTFGENLERYCIHSFSEDFDCLPPGPVVDSHLSKSEARNVVDDEGDSIRSGVQLCDLGLTAWVAAEWQ